MFQISLKNKISLTLIMVLVIVISAFVIVFIKSANTLTHKVNHILYSTILEEEKNEIKNNTLIEKQVIEKIAKLNNVYKELETDINFLFRELNSTYTNFKNNPQIKDILIDIVSNTKKECKSRYFFIIDQKGNIIAYPKYLKYSMPSNIFAINFPSIKELKNAIKELKTKNEIFVYYKWLDPETSKMAEKIAIFKKFEPFNWIIGEGIYVDHIREHLLEKIKTILNIRYGNDLNGYFFAIDLKTKRLLFHPLIPKKADYSHYKLFQYILKHDGFLEYKFLYPATMKPMEKISFAITLKDLDIKIGNGKYFNSINHYLKITQEKTKKLLKSLLLNYILFSLIALVIIIYILNIILNKLITEPIENIILTIEEIIQNQDFSKTIPIDREDEIGSLAKELNNFLRYIQEKLNYYNEILKRL